MSQSIKQLHCVGSSLWPLVREKSCVGIAPLEPSQYRLGDLAVYCGHGIKICHRVLARRVEGSLVWYFMKGDGKLEADGWVPSYRMLGRVVTIDDHALDRLPLSLLSFFFFVHAKFQYALYRLLFRSRFGVWGRQWRRQFVGVPVFSTSFLWVTAPWQILRLRT